MLEKDVERRMREMVQERRGLLYKWTSPGNPGVPDRILITPHGGVIFVELKAENGVLSKMQKWQHNQMRLRNADVVTLYGWDQAKAFVDEVMPL